MRNYCRLRLQPASPAQLLFRLRPALFFKRNRWLVGWQLTGLLFARGGTAFSLLANSNNAFGTLNNRVNNIPGAINRTPNGSQWFSLTPGTTAALGVPASGPLVRSAETPSERRNTARRSTTSATPCSAASSPPAKRGSSNSCSRLHCNDARQSPYPAGESPRTGVPDPGGSAPRAVRITTLCSA